MHVLTQKFSFTITVDEDVYRTRHYLIMRSLVSIMLCMSHRHDHLHVLQVLTSGVDDCLMDMQYLFIIGLLSILGSVQG